MHLAESLDYSHPSSAGDRKAIVTTHLLSQPLSSFSSQASPPTMGWSLSLSPIQLPSCCC
eukprot:3832493-Amphidinium_carterae.2